MAGDRKAMAVTEAEAGRVLKASLEATFGKVMAGLRDSLPPASGET